MTLNRLDFVDCPLCSGHEKIGAQTAEELGRAIGAHLNQGMPAHVETELMNIRNTICNAREFTTRVLATAPEDSWMDA